MRTLTVLFLVSCAVSCADDVESVGETSSELIIHNRLASNRLASNRLAQNRLAQNRLAQNRLSSNRLAQNRLASNHVALDPVAAGDLLATEGGREVLSFAIGCALRTGQTVSAVQDGATYEFEGALGLAPHWLEHPLDEKDQRWISACLLSRVNATGQTVEISLRGPHRALWTSDEEMAAFSLEEGAFWGNVFGPADEPLDWNACRGLDQARGEQGLLADRDCTEPDPERPGFTLCGFKYAGDCGDFAEQPACGGFDGQGTYYTRCAVSERCSAPYRQVITTFVRP